MSQVKLSPQANLDLARLYEFLAHYDLAIADRAVNAIIASLEILERTSQGCPLAAGRKDLRKLVINLGASGYLAFLWL